MESVRDIMKRTGLTRTGVMNIVNRLGIGSTADGSPRAKGMPLRFTEEEVQKVLGAYHPELVGRAGKRRRWVRSRYFGEPGHWE